MKVLNYDRVVHSVAKKEVKSVSTATIHKSNQRQEAPIVSIILLDWECREHFSSLGWLNRQNVPRWQYELIWVELYNRVEPEVVGQVDCLITCGQTGMYHKHLGYNEGVLKARGEIVTICDSDAVFPPDFVESVIKSFDYDKNKKCQRSIVLMHHEMRSSFLFPDDIKEIEDVKDKRWKWWPVNPNAGACMSVLKADAIRYGAFDEHKSYRGYLCGPYELGWRLVNAGMPEIWYDHEVTALWHYAHPDPVGVNGLRASIKIIFENTYPHVDLHAIKAVEAFSTGRMLPLKENPEIFNMRMKDRGIGTPFEAKYSDHTGPDGFPKWLLWYMTFELFISLAMKVIVVNFLRPALIKTLKLLLGKKLYKLLRNLVYGDYEDISVNAMPEIIDTYLTYNIIEYKSVIYGIPMSLGNVDFKSKKQLNRTEIIKGATKDEVIAKLDEVGHFDPELVESIESYNIVKYNNLFYALPMLLGSIDFTDNKQLDRPEILKGNTKEEIIDSIQAILNFLPVFVCSYEHYNIVKFKHVFYAIPKPLERIDFIYDGKTHYQDILRAKTNEELLQLLERQEVFRGSKYGELAAMIDGIGSVSPALIDSIANYNVVRYKTLYYGLSKLLGNIDFNDEDQIESKEVIKSTTYDGVLDKIQERSDIAPELFCSYEAYNIVMYKKILYAVPKCLGAVDFTDESDINREEIIRAPTKEELLQQLNKGNTVPVA